MTPNSMVCRISMKMMREECSRLAQSLCRRGSIVARPLYRHEGMADVAGTERDQTVGLR